MEKLDLTSIRRDGGTQSRAALDEPAIADYAEKLRSGIEFPPMVVFYDGESYWLADGFHRAAAYESAGIDSVTCEVRQGSRREAILHSVGANATHGVRRTNADKRRSVETLLRDEEWQRWSDRKIADVCGVSPSSVAAYRSQLSNLDSPTNEPTARIGADGVERAIPRPAKQFASEDRDANQDSEFVDLPPAVDEVLSTTEPPRERPAERDTIPSPPEIEEADPIQPVADAWGELSQDEQDGFLEAVGAVRLSRLEALVAERSRDSEYIVLRRISEPNSSASRGSRMVAAVLDGADFALARLGLSWSSTAAEAKQAYRRASLDAHPDRGGTTEEFASLTRAYEVVTKWLDGRAA